MVGDVGEVGDGDIVGEGDDVIDTGDVGDVVVGDGGALVVSRYKAIPAITIMMRRTTEIKTVLLFNVISPLKICD